MENVKLKIYAKYISVQILILVIMRYITKFVFNFPPYSDKLGFQKSLYILSYDELYIVFGTILIALQVVFLYISLARVFKIIIKGEISITKEDTEQVRKTCLGLQQKILIANNLFLAIIFIIIFRIIPMDRLLFIEAIIIHFLYFNAGYVITISLVQSNINSIIEYTYKINKESVIPKRTKKISISIVNKIVPLFLAIMFSILIISNSKIIESNGENANRYYKQYIDNLQLTGLSEKEVKYELSLIPLLKESDYYFIMYMDKNQVFISKQTGTASEFFIKYAKHFLNENNGRLYEEYGVEEEGYARKIKLKDGRDVLIGIKYSKANRETFKYLATSITIFVIIYIITLLYSTNSIGKEITRISLKTTEIVNRYYNNSKNKIDVLPITNKNETGELTVLTNEMNRLSEDNLNKSKAYKKILEDNENWVVLGKIAGGIANDLKNPIMSISGAVEGLNALVKEYEKSINDKEVEKKDHNEIAKEMREWIKKIKVYDNHISSAISTIEGQDIKINGKKQKDFTVDELINKVNILIKNELKKNNVVLNINCSIPRKTIIHGNINSLVLVINNILINAIQSYEKDERKTTSLVGNSSLENKKNIDFAITQNNNKILISIEDFGKGISKKIQEKIFKSMIITKTENKMGISLLISNSIIKNQFKGKMEFKSKVGKGTKFNIILPKKIKKA